MDYDDWPEDCQAISRWVSDHRENLPRTLAELSRFPMVWRRAIVPALPLPDRVAVWREHLMTFLQPPSGLTTVQRAFITKIVNELPELLTCSAEEVSRRLDLAAREILGTPLAQRVLALVGEELAEPPAREQHGG